MQVFRTDEVSYTVAGGTDVSTTTEVPRRRRTIAPERMTRQIRVQMPVELDERLRALSARYGVAVGTIARAAMEAGMRNVAEQLRRAARSTPRHEAGPGRVEETTDR